MSLLEFAKTPGHELFGLLVGPALDLLPLGALLLLPEGHLDGAQLEQLLVLHRLVPRGLPTLLL